MKQVISTLGRTLAYTVIFAVGLVVMGATLIVPPFAISSYFGLIGGWPLVVLSGWCIFLGAFGVAIAENYDK